MIARLWAYGMGQRDFDMLLLFCFLEGDRDWLVSENYALEMCNSCIDDFINSVEENHLYMKRA